MICSDIFQGNSERIIEAFTEKIFERLLIRILFRISKGILRKTSEEIFESSCQVVKLTRQLEKFLKNF